MNAESKQTIVLATNSDDAALELRGVKRFSDGSGFYCRVFVRCHGFSAERPFYFSERSFKTALKQLKHMDEHLHGEARLEEDWEHDQFLQFMMLPHGRLLVTGQLVLLNEPINRLTFGFDTDQTCLAPLARALEGAA